MPSLYSDVYNLVTQLKQWQWHSAKTSFNLSSKPALFINYPNKKSNTEGFFQTNSLQIATHTQMLVIQSVAEKRPQNIVLQELDALLILN